MFLNRNSTLALASAAMLLAGTGCATKRFVRTTVAPVETRVGQVETSSKQNTADLDQLEKQVSRVDELAAGADKEAKAANELAKQAGDKATTAGQKAEGAQTLAQEGVTKATAASAAAQRIYENLDNYQLLKNESITFGFNKAELTKDMKAKLDEFSQPLKAQKRYVVEVQGFADPAGPSHYNQELSQRRAAAVVRYLTTQHEIPLRRIQMLGVGEDMPVADNKTRDGRQQNRRVEVKVFALPEGQAEGVATAATAR